MRNSNHYCYVNIKSWFIELMWNVENSTLGKCDGNKASCLFQVLMWGMLLSHHHSTQRGCFCLFNGHLSCMFHVCHDLLPTVILLLLHFVTFFFYRFTNFANFALLNIENHYWLYCSYLFNLVYFYFIWSIC